MKSFRSLDESEVKGEQVFIVENDVDRTPKGFGDLYPVVEVDGVVRRTLGVESHATSGCRKGDKIGIMVERRVERTKEEMRK